MAAAGIGLYAVSQVVKVRNMILGARLLPSGNMNESRPAVACEEEELGQLA
jgi:hypothetical protein